MNFEEYFKQFVKENGYYNQQTAFMALMVKKEPDSALKFVTEAAELWQSENLKEIESQKQRIAELEAGLKSVIKVYQDADFVDIEMGKAIKQAKQLLK